MQPHPSTDRHSPIDATGRPVPRPPIDTPLRERAVDAHYVHRKGHVSRRASLAAGLFAGIAVACLTVVSWPLGLHCMPFVAIGLMTGIPVEGITEASAIGLLIFAVMSMLSGLAYAVAFRRLDRAGVGTGALLGCLHAVIVATALAIGMLISPELPTTGGDLWLGFDVVGLLYFSGLHIVFGAIFGAVAAHRFGEPRGTALPSAPDPGRTPPRIPPREIISPNAPPASRVH